MEALAPRSASWRWLPNAISTLRIFLVPVWLALAFDARTRGVGEVDRAALLAVLLALGASDIIDGFIARRFGLTSNLGATLDAVADKFAQVAMVTFLAWFAAPVFTAVPLWLWGTLLLRDLLLAIGWACVWRKRGKVEVEHKWHGKAASLLLFALVVCSTAGAPQRAVDLGSAVVLGLVVIGTAAYLREGWRQLVG